MTGIGPDAERWDRPVAYKLRELMLASADSFDDAGMDVWVCSDVWWLNTEEAQRLPTVSVGAPDLNALSAYLAARLPSAFSVEGALAVLLDLDFGSLQACCWGASAGATTSAVDAFAQRYLDAFVERSLEAVGQ